MYYRLDSLLGTQRDGSYHVKEQEGGYEYRLSGLRVEIANTGLAPGSASRNFEADARITIEIPMSFGWGVVPPLTMELRTKAAYMPRFQGDSEDSEKSLDAQGESAYNGIG